MRLWSIHPQYLDVKGLLAVWREGLLAQAVLGGRTRGFALRGFAPAKVFTGGVAPRLVQTASGAVQVKPLEPAVPLGAVPPSAAGPSVAAAVKQLEKDDAYQAWLQTQEQSVLGVAICAADDVPAAIPAELPDFVPFLKLAG